MIPTIFSSKRITERLFRLLTLIPLMLPVPITLAAQHTEQNPVVIPYRPGDDNIQLVTVRLNGTMTGTFLLDTGSNSSTISPEMVHRLGLHSELLRSSDGTTLKDEEGHNATAVRIRTLQLGDLTLKNTAIEMPKVDSLSAMTGRKLDGIIGMDILKDFAVLFDFQQHRLTLWAGGKMSSEQRKQYGMEKAHSVPMSDLEKDLSYSAHVLIDGTAEEDLLVDTGSSVTGISARTAHDLHLISLDELENETFYGSSIDHIALVDKITIGDFTSGYITLVYPKRDDGPLPPILGLDFMTQYRVLLDFPGKRMYFKSAERRSVVIPFSVKTVDELPLFDARLADGRVHVLGLSARLASTLDTTLAASWLATALPVNPSPDISAKSVIAGQIVATRVDFPTGEPLFGDQDFKLTPLDALRQTLPMVDGWIGLSPFAIQLDFIAKRITVILPANIGDTAFVPKKTTRIPLIRTNRGYTLRMLVDGKPASFVLSMSCAVTTLNSKKLLKILHPKVVNEFVGEGKRIRVLRLCSLSVGDLQWIDPVVEDSSGTNSDEPNLLGTNFLRRFHGTIDFGGQALYLEPIADYKIDPTENVGVGIIHIIKTDGRMYVSMLAANSTAREAGVKIDDEIVEVNGLIVKQTPLSKIIEELRKPPGTKIMVLIRHGGNSAPRTVILTTRKLI